MDLTHDDLYEFIDFFSNTTEGFFKDRYSLLKESIVLEDKYGVTREIVFYDTYKCYSFRYTYFFDKLGYEFSTIIEVIPIEITKIVYVPVQM